MPIYRIQSPSGKIYRIEGPQDADPNVLFQLAQQQEEAEQIQQLRLDYGPGVLGTLGQATKRGFQQLGSTITDIIPALGASALGFDEYAREQMAEAQEKARAREMEAPTLFPSYKNVRGIGDVPKFVAETIGENVANIGAALVPGVGAAGLAARAGVGAAGRLAATNAGTFLGSYALNAPEIFQNIYENTGELSPSAALIAGSVSAALDSILPAQLAKKLTSQAKAGIVEKVLERSGMDRGLARSVTASVISGIPTEGLTEGAQEAISIAAERFIDKNPDVFGSNEWERITNSAIKGAIAGGAFGGVGGGIEAARTGAERRAAYEDALQRRQERLQERDIAKLGQEIESLQTIDGQMQLPGFELGPATTLYTPPPKEKKLTKEERAAQKAQADADAIAAREAGIPPPITGKQLEMFTATGELTPPMQRAADKQEQILARQAKQKEEAANKEAQARLKRLLSATQLELPGFDQASLKAYQEAETAAAASPQYDLFRPAPTGTTTGQPPAPPTLETITKLDDLIGFGKLLGIGRTARILRPDSPLAGKDISDPAQAAEVKKVLEAYASGKPAAGASANIESFLRRPEFQGVSDVAKPDQQTGGEGAGMVSQPSIQPATGPLGQAEPSRVVSTEPATGEAPIGEATQPAALATPKAPTDRQQRIEFGKALGATYGESLSYRQNQQAANAVVNQDFKGVLAALQKSKNPIIQEVARRAGTLNTKIKLEEGVFESVEDESTIMRQISIDSAKMHLNALDYIRSIAPQIENLPDGAALPYETVSGYQLQAFEKGEPISNFGLNTLVNNKHSMFAPLNLAANAKLNTKEDFLKLRDAMEAATTKLGESNIRMTASASPYRQTIAGAYDAATDTIKIAEDAEGGTYYAKNENLLTHEIVHAQASNAVANPTKEQKPIVERLNNLYQHVKQHYKKVQEQEDSEYYRPPYGVASIQEFLAEGIGNTNFQYDLSRIKYQNTNAWDKFVEYIANLLGLKNDNALTELLTIYAELTNQGDIQQELIEAAKPSQAKPKAQGAVETRPAKVTDSGAYIPSTEKGKDPLASAAFRTIKEDDDIALDDESIVGATLITGMQVQQRNKGLGTKLLNSVVDWADSNDKTLVLIPAAEPDAALGGLNQEQLKAWYARNNFEDRVDYMVRKPQQAKETPQGAVKEKDYLRDDKGEPMVLYHGTMDEVDPTKFNPGSHFGTYSAANTRINQQAKGIPGVSTGRGTDFTGANVVPVVLRINNPLEVDDQEASDEATLRRGIIQGKYPQLSLDVANKEGAFEAARQAGYDAFVYTNRVEDPGKKSYVTLYPEQAESAIGKTKPKKEAPSAVTPTEAQQAKEEGAAAPAEGTEVAGAPAKPTELRAIIKKKIDDQIANMLRANYISEGKELLLKNLPDLDFRGQSYFNLFRIPRLVQNINDKRRFIAKIKDAKKPTNQDKANQEDLTALLNEINKYDPATQKFINRLLDANPALQEKIFGLINNLARKQYTEQIDSVIKVLRQAQQDIRGKTESERRQENINIAQANLADKEARERRLEEEVDLRRAMEALVSGVAKKVKNPLWQEFAESVKNPKKPGKKLPLLTSLYSGPAFNPAQMDMAKQGNINGLLSSIIRQTKDPAIRQVLVRLRGLNLKTKLEVSSPGELVEQTMMAGMYDPDTNTITLDAANGLNAHAFVHELIHAAISNVLSNPSHPLTKEFNKFFDQIQNRLGAAYGAQNLQEFAAELVGNPQFQAILKDIKTPRSESLFKRIMRSIAEFLGFAPKTSAFETGLNFINNAIDITNNVEASAGQKMFLGMGNFPAVGTTGNSMPSPTAAALQNAKNMLSDLGDSGLRTAAFGLLRLDNINQMYKKELPALQNLLDAVEKRSGAQERFIKGINDKYKSFVAVQKKLPQQMKTLNDIAIDARIAEVDILDPNFVPSAKQVSEFNRLKQAFRSLDASVQDVYRTVRADYDASFNRYMKVIKDAADKVSPSLAAKLAQEFQTRKPLIGYVPFQRYGDFYVEYTDPSNNERTVSGFESRSERQAFIDTMLKNIPHKSYQKLEDVRFTGEGVPQSSFIFKIMDGLRKQNASQDQLNAVYQAYLATFPGESLMRQFMKSKNVRGMERDLVRNYGDLMIRWARKLTNAEYVPQIDRALYELKEQGKVTSDPNAEAAVRNILEQAPFLHNPTFNNFVHTATQLSYFEYIAGNISSAIINLSSVPMMAWPMLVGKFGWGKATETMLAAGRTAVNDWGKNPKYKNLYDTLNDHAQLEHTMAREILEGRRQSTGDYLGLKARVLDGLSIPFIAAEKFNRGITAIAAFDLAKASGMSEKEAIRYALDTVKDVHTSGMAATGPRWTQAPLGRIFFTFKSFVWNSAYVMARAFHQSFKGETKEIQHAARRQLLSTYGMATVLTGVKGMPFYGAVSTLATMLNALFGDDDEPFNFDEFMRDAFGEMFFKGFANEFLNLEVASRAGIATDLLFRDDPRGVAEHGYVLSAMQQAFGPLGSIAVNTGRAVEMFKDGHIERGLETVLPSFVRNFMKGTRYMLEGATTLDGNPVMGDISAYNSLMQMIGFAPADLSTRYEKIQVGKSFEREVLKRRGQLLDLYDMANTSGDTELLEKTTEDIQRFNETVPNRAITKQVLDRSAAQRRAAEQQMIYGVRFDPKLRQQLIDEILEDED